MGRSGQDTYKGFPNPSRIISVEDARHILKSRNVIFVDTRNYWRYVGGHIPGSVNLELYAFHWVDTSRRGLQAFVGQMAKLFGSFGIDNRKRVIFYQNNSGYDAARGVWLLDYLGNKRGKLLDGGLNLWKRKMLPLSTEDPVIRPAVFRPQPDNGEIATLDLLLAEMGRRSTARVLDVRSAGEYSGRFRRANKGGHVPRAVNLEWSSTLKKDGTLKNGRTLERIYGALGLGKNDEILTYCQSGYRAAHTWLVLKLLGYRTVRNYIGSWYEWGGSRLTRVAK